MQAWGRVDIVINNAGIVRDAPFEDITADRLDPLMDVHLKGAFHVTRPAWKVMREQHYGRILNTCSAAGLLGAERMSNYGAAKTGLVGLTRVLPPKGPTTTSRSTRSRRSPTPGCWRIRSRSNASRPDDPSAQAVLDDLVAQYLQKLDPALVAPVAAFLTHRDCPVSGEIYTVGAGHVARFFIGRTKGFYSPALSIEQVRDHLDEIRDEAGYSVPGGPADEMSALFATIMANQPD